LSAAPTPSQTVGPYFAIGLCERPANELVDPGAPGAVRIAGRVLDGAGLPVADSMVEIWQADESGRHREGFGWGRCGTDQDGRFSFLTVKPGPVEDPGLGRMAPHVSVLVFARGLLKPVRTRLYFPDEADANGADPVLAAVPEGDRPTLVARAGDDGLEFDVRLQGERQTVFFTL
jgi:protocatechuate 3,4-dioxygenase alpha subunit